MKFINTTKNYIKTTLVFNYNWYINILQNCFKLIIKLNNKNMLNKILHQKY